VVTLVPGYGLMTFAAHLRARLADEEIEIDALIGL
jgi:hypothetical protein